MKVVVDYREKERADYAVRHYVLEGVEQAIIEKLEVGDFVFNGQVCFEYKTIDDFLASVNDGRVFRQCHDMVERYPYSYLVVTGQYRDYIDAFASINRYTRFNRLRYHHSLLKVECFMPVLFCDTMVDAFDDMLYVAEQVLSCKPVSRLKKKNDNPAVNYLSTINGVNFKTAMLICNCLNINSLDGLLELSREDLESISGIGRITADKILNGVFGSNE